MTGSARIDYIEAALMALLQGSAMQTAYGAPIDVQSLGSSDFDEKGRLVLQPPSLRVRFMGTAFPNLRDNQRLTCEAQHLFEIWCFESSRRSLEDERLQTLVLVATVENQLAGARLTLTDGTTTLPISLKGVALIEDDKLPIDQYYAVRIQIEGPAQFDGPNANFPGSGT